jgi:hypothetical protein
MPASDCTVDVEDTDMTQRDRYSQERGRREERGYGEGYGTQRIASRNTPWNEEDDRSAYRRSGAEPYATSQREWDDLDDSLISRRDRETRGRGYDETEFYSGQGADYVPQRRHAMNEDLRWQDPSRAYGYPQSHRRAAYRDDERGGYERGRYADGGDFASRAYESPRIGQGGFAHEQPGRQPYYGEGRQGVEPGPYVYGSSVYGMPGDASDMQRTRGHRGRGPRSYLRSDERITEDLNERLTEDDHVDAGDISVNVKEGVATLSGTVEARWMKHRAEDIAEACSGVRDVRNELRVGASPSAQDVGTAASRRTGGTAH